MEAIISRDLFMHMRSTPIAFLFALVATTGLAQSHAHDGLTVTDQAPAPVGVKELTPEELSSMMNSGPIFIVDVNEDFTYAEAHVRGAKLMVYDEITADKLPADRQMPLAFYCYSPECPAAGMAAHTAVTLGFANVYHMKAGITGWQDARLPTEP